MKRASTTLRGLAWDHPRAYAPLNAVSKYYAQHTGVTVAWERRSLKDFGDQHLVELASRYDLLLIDHPHVGIAAESQCLVPLDEYLSPSALEELAADSPGGSHQSYNYAGHQWALAVDAACQVAASRPDLSRRDAANRATQSDSWPKTWGDAIHFAEQLRTQGLWMGMALCPTDCVCSFLTLIAQGASTPCEDGTTFELSSVVAAVSCLRHLKSVSHPESTSWNPIQLYDAMSEGDEIVYSPLAFGYINYGQPGFRNSPLTFGPIPGRVSSLLGGAGIAISRTACNPAAAARFAAHVASSACQAGIYLASGGQPAHAHAWRMSDDRIPQFIKGARETLRHAFTRPRSLWWPKLQPQLGEIIHESLVCQTDVAVTSRAINERYRKCRETS